jgi:hypothetical protein
LSAGNHRIRAVYSGDIDFKPSNSPAVRQIVQASSGGSATSTSGSLVDQVLGVLLADDDATAPTSDLLIPFSERPRKDVDGPGSGAEQNV